MATTPKPLALISTPTENAECSECARLDYDGVSPAARRFSPTEFAHCSGCGSTDLVDTRSPWTVLAEAKANVVAAREAGMDPGIIWGREDVVLAVAKIAAQVSPDHCGECMASARKVAAA